MRIAPLFAIPFLLGALCTQVRAGDPHWSRVRAEQLDDYESFADAVEWSREMVAELHQATRLLAEHSNLEEFRRQGSIHAGSLPQDTTLVFELPAAKLAPYRCLDWITLNLSWPNQLLRMGGYGMVSRAEILRLKVENMKLSNAPRDSTEAMEARYLQARKDLDAYLASQRWVD